MAHLFSQAAIASQYFLYFGVMGLYLPYFNLYCYHLGFSGFHIGVLSALRSVTMVIFPMIWGALADRTKGRRPIYILCNAVSAAAGALFLLTEDFAAMALITVGYGIFYSPVISFLEAITMESLGREKKSYGRIRLWGSISFITVVLLFGKLIESFSVRLILFGILAGSLLLVPISLTVPRDRPSPPVLLTRRAKALLLRRSVVFLTGGFLMLVSHGAYYGFFSIHLETLGYSSTFIGISWAVASSAEIVAMLYSEAIFSRFALERVLTASFAAAVLRWLILGSVSAPAAILLSQLLHAMTYGTFHMASILYMDRLSPPDAKNLGQALNNALTYGLGLMAGFFINGALYKTMGCFGLFQISAWIALAGGAAFGIFRFREGRGRIPS
ncbi:MAG: MFS transporter [Desulfobacterales bacterium]|nr:MFS transporter [Desulfobacterales bacterium]